MLQGCFSNKDGQDNDDDTINPFQKKPSAYHYRYDSTLAGDENFLQGFIDTFSIGANSFRILCDSTPGRELLLQKKIGEGWDDNLYSYYGVQGYNREADVNNDGWPDFVFFNWKDCNAYLFDSVKRKFNFYPVNLSLVFYCFDSTRNLYHQEWARDDGSFCTQLFGYRDSSLYYRYSAYMAKDIPAPKGQKSFRLYRCENGKMKDTVFLRNCTADTPFSSVSMNDFWKRINPE